MTAKEWVLLGVIILSVCTVVLIALNGMIEVAQRANKHPYLLDDDYDEEYDDDEDE